MRALFLPMGNAAVASSRYRLHQFLPHLPAYGIQPQMILWPVRETPQRKLMLAAQTLLAARQADVTFIQKRHDEAALWAARLAQRVIFDFDDAIWLPPPMDDRNPAKIPRLMENLRKILKTADLVIAGNPFLRDFAQQYNPNITILPTVIDLKQYTLQPRETSNQITIGWVGASSNLPYLSRLENVFRQIAKRYPGRIRLKIVSNGQYQFNELPVENVRWTLEREVEDLRGIDIGIMPLADSDWERGKCGFKLLQYMALGIPAVGSSVGVNTTIIQHGSNGFLPTQDEDWFIALNQLIEDADLRKRIGEAGWQTVEKHYSLQAVLPRFYEAFDGVVKGRSSRMR